MNVMKQNNYSISKACFTIYSEVFNNKECEEICERQIDKDIVYNDKESIVSNFKNSTDRFSYQTCILNDAEDLEKKLIAYVFDCNSKIYGYDIWGIEEDIKVLTFKEGDFLREHERTLWYSPEPNDRKLTCYVFLNNEESYNGGHFKASQNLDVKPLTHGYNKQGNILIYPSFVSLSIERIGYGFMQLLTFDIIGPKLR